MEVILLQKIANLGNIGDRVKVKPGFGRNFLLPGGKATLATAENIAKFESRRAELEAQAAKELSSAQQRAVALEGFTLTITAKAGSEGKLFGSIGTIGHRGSLRDGRARHRARRGAPPGRSDPDGRRTRDFAAPAQRRRHPGDAHGGCRRVETLRAMVAILRQDELRTPPHSVEAEQAVLGGLMLDPNAWDAVADIVVAAGLLPPRPPAHLRGDHRDRGDPRVLRRRDDLRTPRTQGPARGDRRARLPRHDRA